ncbi:RING-H2 finger protein-like protein [Rhynchospora pubera]|uniref:RING-type E3 ubiquitin transferase n=1 Tax=Rhynchospora pubera TaxID=906938 RepID=A0AAV8D0X2_9POAL|nr:RING-H2 finger protein-like protein [Rhynchospora pubera]
MSTSIETVSSVTKIAELMVGVLIIIFVLFLLLVFMYLYARRYPGAIPLFGWGRSRVISEPERGVDVTVPPCGLDPKAINSLPFIVFKQEDFKQKGIDCAVCLSEVSNGEKARILPKCDHGFHLDCIDMWLFSHSTCPLCRCPVVDGLVSCHPLDYVRMVTGTDTAEPIPNFPTNVLFWGSQDQISSGVAPRLPRPGEITVIEIPRQPADNTGLTPAAASPSTDETKLLSSARVRSLSRLLVRGSRGIMIGNSCNPRIVGDDIELGAGVLATAESSSPIAATSS